MMGKLRSVEICCI